MDTTIGQLLVIAGPPASGKSTLIQRLASDPPDPLSSLDFDGVTSWPRTGIKSAGDIKGRQLEKLVLHFDIFGVWRTGHRLSKVERVLRSSREIVVLTLWVRPAVLLGRIAERVEQRETERRELSIAAYSDPAALVANYQWWFDLIGQYPVKEHWLIDSSEPELVVSSLEAWSSYRGLLLPA